MSTKGLIADGVRKKPPISLTATNPTQEKDNFSVITEHSSDTRRLSTTFSDRLSLSDDFIDIDNETTSTTSESYARDESTSDEGNEITVFDFNLCYSIIRPFFFKQYNIIVELYIKRNKLQTSRHVVMMILHGSAMLRKFHVI